MTYFCLGLFAFALLILILPARSGNTPEDLPEPERSQKPPRSNTHFIDAHLHKDDAKKARHKQNQWPL